MTSYPVLFDAGPPARYERVQVLLRMLLLFALAALGGTLGWLYFLLYLALPLVAAAGLAGRTSQEFLEQRGASLERLLHWVVAFLAYLAFLTDELPGTRRADAVRYEIERRGTPTVGSALARLVTSLPGFVLGALVGLVGAVVSVVAAVFVLVEARVPASVYEFQRGAVRWQARLFAYHASLVDAPPPLEFDGASSAGSPPEPSPG